MQVENAHAVDSESIVIGFVIAFDTLITFSLNHNQPIISDIGRVKVQWLWSDY